MTKLSGEGGSRSEDVGEGQEQKAATPTVEDLKQQRTALEARFAEIQRQKEANVKKQVGDREVVIAEDKRLVSMLEEAKKTLTFFEAQEQGGLLTDPKDQEDLRSLRELIASLQEQREESAQKYDAIMGVPEVKDEVLKDAYAEHEDREFQGEMKKAKADLEKRADQIFVLMQERVHKFVEALVLKEKSERQMQEQRNNLIPIITEAQRKSKSGEVRVALSTYDKADYLQRLTLLRKKLGLFDGADKGAIDSVIVENNAKVLMYEDSMRNYEKAQAEMDAMTQETNPVEEAYLALMADAVKKENELRGDNQSVSLSTDIKWRIRRQIDDYAGIKHQDPNSKGMIGKYNQWSEALVEPKNAVMYSLRQRLEDKARELRDGEKKM